LRKSSSLVPAVKKWRSSAIIEGFSFTLSIRAPIKPIRSLKLRNDGKKS
jgi:hypothetical protein